MDVVYVCSKGEERVVGIKSKPAFKGRFQISNSVDGRDMTLLKNDGNGRASETSSDAAEIASSSWWTRGRHRIKQILPTAEYAYR